MWLKSSRGVALFFFQSRGKQVLSFVLLEILKGAGLGPNAATGRENVNSGLVLLETYNGLWLKTMIYFLKKITSDLNILGADLPPTHKQMTNQMVHSLDFRQVPAHGTLPSISLF